MHGFLSEETKASIAITPAAGVAGTTDLNGAILDMQGWDGVIMTVVFGVITATAVTSVKAQQDTDPAGGTMADLLGTGQTVADDADDKAFEIDLKRPLERYVRLVVDRGTANAVVSSAMYRQYRARNRPPAAQGTNVALERHLSPIEGTA